MAGTIVNFKTSSFTNGGDGFITVVSTTGFYANAKVQIYDSGTGAGASGVITNIVSSTVMGIRLDHEPDGSARFGRSDVSAYDTVTQSKQLIYNQNDNNLT